MDEDTLQRVILNLNNWASEKEQLKKLWIYGSRVTKTHRPNSDLDIAFEIFPLKTEIEKSNFQSEILPSWKQEIQGFTPWKVHLVPWAGNGTNVALFVAESGKIVYQCRITSASK